MKSKSLLISAIVVPSIAIGGFWVYQANRFESSVNQELSHLQEFLKDQGVSFTYDAVKTSPFSFKAHLVNPAISGTIPDLEENLKGLKGIFAIKGEIIACFSPFANTVTFTSPQAESQLKVEGPIEVNLSSPASSESILVLKRKEYDFFGKNPFLCFDNMKGVDGKIKGVSLLLNDQKFLEIKKGNSDISWDYKDKALDVSCTSDIEQMQFFNVEKPLKGTIEGLVDALNLVISNELLTQAALGAQDQKVLFSFHVNDALDYIETLKSILIKEDTQSFEKLAPEGIRLDVTDFSTENKVYQSSLKGKFERLKDQFTANIAGDFKVTDQWGNYWQEAYKKIIGNFEAIPGTADVVSILQNKEFVKNIMPNLQSFGKIHFSMDIEAPTPLSFTAGKASFQLKSDLYDLSAKGALAPEGSSIKMTTRNVKAMMGDLGNYIDRASDPFVKDHLNEIQMVKFYLQSAQAILNKVLEPQGASDQQVDIQMGPQGIKIGNYDLAEILPLLGQGGGEGR